MSEKHSEFVNLCNKMYVLGANNASLRVLLLANERK
jgi:hypothetical protein